MVIPRRQRNSMGRKQDQAMSKFGVRKQVDQGHVRKKQQGKPKDTEALRQGPLKSKAGFTLYKHCSDALKETKSSVHKSLVSGQKQTQGKNEAEDKFMQQPDVVSQMQIHNEQTRSGEASSILIPTADIDSSADSTWYGYLDRPEFGTPFNKRLVSSTPDPQSLLEAELTEHHMNLASVMCPQVIPERDTTLSSKPTEVLTTMAGNLSEKLKIQRQQFQENQQLLQQKQCQQPGNQWQEYSQQNQHPVLLNLQDDGLVLQKLIHQPAVHSSDALKAVPTCVPVAKCIGDQENLKRHAATSTSVNAAINSQQDHPMWHTSSRPNHSSAPMMPKISVDSDTLDNIVSIRTKLAQPGSPVSKVTIMCPPENTQPNLSQPNLPNDYEPGSAFSKPETCAGAQNGVMSYLESSTVKKRKFTKLDSNIVENNLPDSQVSGLPVHQEVTHIIVTNNQGDGKKLKSGSVKEIKHNFTAQLAGDPSRGENALPVKSKTISIKETNITYKSGVQNNVKYSLGKKAKNNTKFSEQPSNLNSACVASPLQSQRHNIKIVEELRSSLLNEDNLDTSSDTCDLEVNNVLKEHTNNTDDNSKAENSGLHGNIDNKSGTDNRMSVASVSSNLSNVIAFLKTNAFNQAKESEGDGSSITDNKTTDTKAAYIPATDSRSPDKKQSGDQVALDELIRQYLPETVQSNESNNNNKHLDACNLNTKSRYLDGSDCDKDFKIKDQPDANFPEEAAELNVNQNHFHDEDSDYEVLPPGRRKNLQYLEKMADPALQDVTCRLALKATALRDVELRELIDEMIILTDASLGREDARFQSAQMFFAEENNKLKKRIQTINQQLDAKERQERLGTFSHSDNDVLHLERKLMYLQDEKENLDNQVTTLLKEKAKWLMTQQDLVRALSLKDHELLKLEEKHQEEKKSLLHSLEQATQNSQGVHYKLSVADKEISNLEQCIKSRNMEIVNLKDALKEMEGRLKECERHSKFKSQEILHLHDLVDALKIGVGHVLQAYESSSNKDNTTAEQRQGMENLRQMVHPEEYRSMSTDPDIAAQAGQRRMPTQGPHDYRHTFSSSQTSSQPKESKAKMPFGRQEYHPHSLRDPLYQRHHSMEEPNYWTDHYRRHQARDNELDVLPQRLTSETLEEHNKRFLPVNKLMWRSLDNEPQLPPQGHHDPYYSDSEIEIHGRSRRRTSLHRHGVTAGNLQGQFKPHSRLPHGQPQARTEWYPRVQKDYFDQDMARRSPDTTIPTLESETIPKSRDVFQHSLADTLSEESYYSTLRSEPIPQKPYMPERTSGDINLAEEARHSRSLPVTHPRHRHKYNIDRRNDQHHSLRLEHGQIPGSSVPEHSWGLNDQEAHFVTLRPAHLSHDQHESFQQDAQTFPKTLLEGARGSHLSYDQEKQFTTAEQTRTQMLQIPNQSVENGGAAFHMSQPHTHHSYPGRQPETAQCNDSLEHPSFHMSQPHTHHNYPGRQPETAQCNDSLEHPSFPRHSLPANDIHSPANERTSFSDISLSRRATKNSDSATQREFFQGTELSASLSTISEVDISSVNNNQLKNLNEDPFSSGIATLDEKIANLQRKIDRTKAKYS